MDPSESSKNNKEDKSSSSQSHPPEPSNPNTFERDSSSPPKQSTDQNESETIGERLILTDQEDPPHNNDELNPPLDSQALKKQRLQHEGAESNAVGSDDFPEEPISVVHLDSIITAPPTVHSATTELLPSSSSSSYPAKYDDSQLNPISPDDPEDVEEEDFGDMGTLTSNTLLEANEGVPLEIEEPLIANHLASRSRRDDQNKRIQQEKSAVVVVGESTQNQPIIHIQGRKKPGCSCSKARCQNRCCGCFKLNVACTPKCKCRDCENKHGRKEDFSWLNEIPDDVISNILSFLPTNEAVKTSTLSSRWRGLWKDLWLTCPALNFDDSHTHYDYFGRFVSRAFYQRQRDSLIPLKSFFLKWCIFHEEDHADTPRLLSDVVNQPTLENLILDISYARWGWDRRYNMSTSVLSCKTLTVLKLCGISFLDDLGVVEVELIHLKTLHLNKISFTHSYGGLLHGCPMLEELCLKEIVGEFGDEEAKLTKLVRADFSDLENPPPLAILSNVESVKLRELFDWLHNVELLRAQVKWWSFQLDDDVMFHNLTRLELIISEGRMRRSKWNYLIQLLQSCPKLQNLTIDIDELSMQKNRFCYDDWKDPEIVPECLLSHLRTCSLPQSKFAQYIMDNSRVLRAMKIRTTDPVDTNARRHIVSNKRTSTTFELSYI